MTTLLLTLLTGLVATALMSLVLYAIHWRGVANADMIRAIGSLLTRNEGAALAPGLVVHLVSGMVFAFVYVAVWSTLPLPSLAPQIYLWLGLITGTGHGLVVSFALVVLVAENHPLPRFQQAGLGVAVAHWVAHVVYGVTVGVGAGLFLLRFPFMPVLGQ